MRVCRFYFGDQSLADSYWVANRLVDCVGPWEDAWLWLDNPDTWKRQGLHLYDHLRQSYGERRLIKEAPVHQFHGYEQADLTSFVVVAILNQWSMYVVTSHDYGRLFISQSSGAEVWVGVENLGILNNLGEQLRKHGIEFAIETIPPATPV